MSHVVKDTSWCTIDIDTVTGRVFLQERWQYTWLVRAGLPAWTLQERRNFHNTADRAIWAAWSNRARLRARGTSRFANQFAGRDLQLELDIRWVTTRPHWNVNVTKIPAGQLAVSSVQWRARTITLDSNDVHLRTFTHGAPTPNTTQMPVAHEFGHAVGNTIVLHREGDEYPAGRPHVADVRSIMNVGHELRRRHFDTVIDELNTMIAGTTFSVRAV